MQSQDFSLAKYLWLPVHREGWPFIALFAVASGLLGLLWGPLGWIGLVLTAWCVYFFRNPDRVTPVRPGLVISPADGAVCMVGPSVPPAELEMGDAPRLKISVFMSVFDVHVNRIPLDGRIEKTAYVPGKFLNASLDKASEDNERMAIRMGIADDVQIGFVQVAGLVARRIKCDLSEGQVVRAGERFGLIRFGSRVDIYLPEGTAAQVVNGQRCIAGETVLADLGASEPAREGEVR